MIYQPPPSSRHELAFIVGSFVWERVQPSPYAAAIGYPNGTIKNWCFDLQDWFLIVLFALAATWIRRTIRGEQTPPGRCSTCGYDLRATPDRCPECGTVYPPFREKVK
jgi:hypothetical protein